MTGNDSPPESAAGEDDDPQAAATIEPGPEEEGLSYEDAREQLVQVVRALEDGGSSLEQSLALWERAERLATTCQRWLQGAQSRLDAALGHDETDSEDDAD